MASLRPEQREQLAQLMSRRCPTPTWPRRWRSWPTTCAPCGPVWTGADRDGPGGSRWATATPSRRSPSSPTSRRWSSSCRRTTRARPSTTSTSSAGAAARAATPRPTCGRCATSSASWSGRATCPAATTGCGSPRGRCAGSARPRCKRVFAQLDAAGRGDHDDRRTGAADEPTGLTRPWKFGDELPIDAVRTVPNALAAGAGCPSGRARCSCAVEDFEVAETERRTTAAVALCVDLSFSMVPGGPLGADEADRAGAVAPGRDPVPAGRAADHRLQPDRPPADARCSWPRSSRSGCRAPTCSTR